MPKRLRFGTVPVGFAAASLVLLLTACDGSRDLSRKQTSTPPFILLDNAEAGIEFLHFNGASGRLYMAEILGAGVALIDYDNDGDLDVYLVQGNTLMATPGGSRGSGSDGVARSDRLYRNNLEIREDGSRRLRFADVTEASGIVAEGYGMGVATGDFDNDGWQDLYVTNLGPNQLWRNAGDGTFEDVTESAGVAGDGSWSTSAAFLDIDGDQLPDLYVANYVVENLTEPRRCYARNSAPDYCPPKSYLPRPNQLYRNLGGGEFLEVSAASGVGSVAAASLGVMAADFNQDGRVDIFVANDGMDNELWINEGNNTFREQGLLSGVAVNGAGEKEASMGVSAGDFDGDGDLDLVMTHLSGETNTLYVNDGQGQFVDRTIATGLAAPSLPYTGFGAAWFDYDNDGWLDLLVANGAVSLYSNPVPADQATLAERNQLFHARGDGSFEDVTDRAGEALQQVEVSRGAAFGDMDNDGDTDVIITNNGGPVRVLMNQAAEGQLWLGLSLKEGQPGRYAQGASGIANIKTADGGMRKQWRFSATGGSYLSASDPRILLGLGASPRIEQLLVLWQNGDVEEWQDLPVNQYHELVHGTGKLVESSDY